MNYREKFEFASRCIAELMHDFVDRRGESPAGKQIAQNLKLSEQEFQDLQTRNYIGGRITRLDHANFWKTLFDALKQRANHLDDKVVKLDAMSDTADELADLASPIEV